MERVLALAMARDGCQGCNFYRNEAVPPVGGRGLNGRHCCLNFGGLHCPKITQFADKITQSCATSAFQAMRVANRSPLPAALQEPGCRLHGAARALQASLTTHAGWWYCPAGRHWRPAVRAAAGEPAPQRQPRQGEPGAHGVGRACCWAGAAACLPGLPAWPAWPACLACLLQLPADSSQQCRQAAPAPGIPAAPPLAPPCPNTCCSPRMVGFIGGSNDFFIAVMDHRDWGGAFIV